MEERSWIELYDLDEKDVNHIKNMISELISSKENLIEVYGENKYVDEFEEKIRKKFGRKYSLAFTSGTSSINALFFALKEIFGKGKVIFSSLNWVSCITPCLHYGFIPVFLDIDDNFCINLDQLKEYLANNDDVIAIYLSYIFGYGDRIEKIKKIASEYCVKVIEDISQVIGLKYDDKYYGQFGDYVVSSLSLGKNLTSGEGGFLMTNDEDVYEYASLYTAFNKKPKSTIRKTNIKYLFYRTGLVNRTRMSPFHAVIALVLLDKLDEIVRKRSKIYKKALNEIEGDLEVVRAYKDLVSGYRVVIYIKNEDLLNKKSKFVEFLNSNMEIEFDIPRTSLLIPYLPTFRLSKYIYGVECEFLNLENFEKITPRIFVIVGWPFYDKILDGIDLKNILEIYKSEQFDKYCRNYLTNFEASLRKKANEDGIDKIVVGAVVEYKGKVLLLKRVESEFYGGIHELPSGNVEEGETLFDTLIREIKEETNLEVEKIKGYIDYFDYLSRKGKKKRQFNFVVEAKGTIKLSEEHSDYVLLDVVKYYRNYHLLNITESVRGILNKYFTFDYKLL